MLGLRPQAVLHRNRSSFLSSSQLVVVVVFALRLVLLLSAVAVLDRSAAVQAAIQPVEEEESSGEVDGETVLKDFMICRHCGTDISLSNFLLSKPSPSAVQALNVTLYGASGILVQHLVNTIGSHFRVVVVRKAHCAAADHWSKSHTWFPGYSWKICACPKCAVQLGWMFEPFASATIEKRFPTDGVGFYLLIVRNVVSETFVNSLIATDWDKKLLP